MAEQWDALEREFAATGVCVVRGVLSGDQVHAMREALAADREEHASEWNIFGRSRDGGPIGESGRWQSNNIMLHSEAYDAVVAHPAVLPLVRRLMGAPVLTGTGAWVRDPVHEPAPAFGDVWPVGTDAVAPWPRTRSSAAGSPTSRTMEPNRIHWQMWHREQGGLHLPSHRLCIPSMQVRFQLDNCDSTTHTLSTVPESVEAKRALPCEPRGAGPFSQVTGQFIVDSWRNMHLPEGVDVHVNAGDVLLLNNSNIHCGTVRTTPQPRRDVNLGFSHRGLSQNRVRAGVPERILAAHAELIDTEPLVEAPAPEWNQRASALGGGHVVGIDGTGVQVPRDGTGHRATPLPRL